MPFKCVSAGQCTCWLHHARETVKLLCIKKPGFIPLDFFHLQTVHTYPVDYQIWTTMQACVYDIEMQFGEKQNGYASNIMTIKLNSCEQLMLASGDMQ